MNKRSFQKRVVLSTVALTTITLLLHGCATVTIHTREGGEKTMTIDEFKKYTEDVFRRQNQASNQVIMLAEDVDRTTYQKLAEAEGRMLEACGPLNDIAARQRDQASVGLTLKLEIARTIDACDRATEHLETLLHAVEQ